MKQLVPFDTSPPHRVTDPNEGDPAVMLQLPSVALTSTDIAKLRSKPKTTRLDASDSLVVVGTVSALAGLAVITAAISAAPAAATKIVKIFCRFTAFPLSRRVRDGGRSGGIIPAPPRPFNDLARTP
jgi:hypothetical protein